MQPKWVVNDKGGIQKALGSREHLTPPGHWQAGRWGGRPLQADKRHWGRTVWWQFMRMENTVWKERNRRGGEGQKGLEWWVLKVPPLGKVLSTSVLLLGGTVSCNVRLSPSSTPLNSPPNKPPSYTQFTLPGSFFSIPTGYKDHASIKSSDRRFPTKYVDFLERVFRNALKTRLPIGPPSIETSSLKCAVCRPGSVWTLPALPILSVPNPRPGGQNVLSDELVGTESDDEWRGLYLSVKVSFLFTPSLSWESLF